MKCWIPPSFTDPDNIFVSFPSLRLPPSLCTPPPFFFFSLWTAYCSILKVPACVLSCPLLPSMHRSDLELCWLRMGAHFWCWERGGGEDRQTLWCCFIYSFHWFPSAPTAVINLKRAFFSPSFFFFAFFHSGPEIVSTRLKKKWKNTCCNQSLRAGALSWCDPHSLIQAKAASIRLEGRCVSVCLRACV